jgi:hypothetical protein
MRTASNVSEAISEAVLSEILTRIALIVARENRPACLGEPPRTSGGTESGNESITVRRKNMLTVFLSKYKTERSSRVLRGP